MRSPESVDVECEWDGVVGSLNVDCEAEIAVVLVWETRRELRRYI